MSLVTRCPLCRTLFRVTSAQLESRAGKVRCGRCMHVFDGFQSLAAEPADGAGAVSTAGATAVHMAPDRTAIAPPKTEAPPATTTQSPAAAPSADRAVDRAEAAASTPNGNGGSSLRPLFPGAPGQPLAQRLLRRPTPVQMWSVGAAGLLILLGLQMAVAYRSELAARYSLIKSVLTAVCERAGCTVSLPQRPDLVRIEASDVHMIDASRPQLIQLTATLRSYAGYDLAYPALDLVLTNSNEHALARRIFTPDEYLDRSRDPGTGIAPNAEITVALDLDTGNLNAAGFRLDLLPAPNP